MEQVNYRDIKGMVRLFVEGNDTPSPWFPMQYIHKHVGELGAQGVRVTLMEQGNYKEGIDKLLYCIQKGVYLEVDFDGARKHVYYLDGSWYIGEIATDEVWVRIAIQNHYMQHGKEYGDDLPFIVGQYQAYKAQG